jgi:hypothetical protein
MVDLVESMLRLHKDSPRAKTPHEQEFIERTIAATDGQTDALACNRTPDCGVER